MHIDLSQLEAQMRVSSAAHILDEFLPRPLSALSAFLAVPLHKYICALDGRHLSFIDVEDERAPKLVKCLETPNEMPAWIHSVFYDAQQSRVGVCGPENVQWFDLDVPLRALEFASSQDKCVWPWRQVFVASVESKPSNMLYTYGRNEGYLNIGDAGGLVIEDMPPNSNSWKGQVLAAAHTTAKNGETHFDVILSDRLHTLNLGTKERVTFAFAPVQPPDTEPTLAWDHQVGIMYFMYSDGRFFRFDTRSRTWQDLRSLQSCSLELHRNRAGSGPRWQIVVAHSCVYHLLDTDDTCALHMYEPDEDQWRSLPRTHRIPLLCGAKLFSITQ